MGRKARDKKSRPAPIAAPAAGAARTEAAQPTSPAPVSRPLPRRTQPLPPRVWLWAIALLAATAAVYRGSLDTPFLLDDPINITKNAQIQHPLGILALVADPRAVVTASLRLNYLTGGFQVSGYHVLNVLAHAATGLLVFALARATLRLPVFGGRYARSADDLAGVVALVFLLHPMQTESVTYVIQRAEVFVSAALLASLLALVAMKDAVTARSMAMLAAACVLGAYSKPSFAAVPALLFVYDACFLSRGRASEMARRWPAYLLAAAAAIVTFALTKTSGGFTADTAGFDVEGITPSAYLAAQFGVVVQYLRVALWPAHLCFDCGYRGAWPVLSTVLGNSVAVPAAILAAIAAASLACWKRRPLLPFAVFGSAVVLSPTSSIVPLADFYVEHRMYLPIAFLAVALVPTLHDLAAAVAARLALPGRIVAVACAAAAAVVVGALAITTVARNHLLADPIALMEDALAQAPQNERVHYNLANAYGRLGRQADAIPHYEAAIRLAPHVVRSYENLGSLYLQQGKVEDALRVFLAGAEAKPEVAMAHRNVAAAYLRLGRAEEALDAARRSLAIEPTSVNGHRLAGDALLALGRRAEAAEAFRSGLAASPGEPTLTERLQKAEQR